ncbi:MAG: hypothetical protein ABJZ55_24525 [Fuerstiella sp.]
MNRERIERQIKQAAQDLETCEKALGADAKALKKSPKWRAADADLRALKRRLIAVKGVEDREKEALARKAEATAAE